MRKESLSRLMADRVAQRKEIQEAGNKAGIEWIEEVASVSELQKLEKLTTDAITCACSEGSFRPAENFCELFCNDGRYAAESLFGDDMNEWPEDAEYFVSFRNGAVSEWTGHKDEILSVE